MSAQAQRIEHDDMGTASNILHGNEYKKMLTFKVGREVFGTDINTVKEIIEYGIITDVPLSPAEIRGVINLRGTVVPVVDLAVRLGKETGGQSKRTCIIIVEQEYNSRKMDIGFVVDEVDQVLDISPEDIEAAPDFGTSIKSEFISGFGRTENGMFVLLKLDEILSIKSLSELM